MSQPLPFQLNPSNIARYFFHDCQRFLRYMSTPAETKGEMEIPEWEMDRSSIMQAIIESGAQWEKVVLEELGEKVHVAPGEGDLEKRRFSVAETVELLRTVQPGEYIYQATLRAYPEFYKSYGFNRELVAFSDCHPDLIAVREGESGRRIFRIIDIKRGEELRITYRVQVFLYALILEGMIAHHGLEDSEVDLKIGGAWLGGTKAPEAFQMDTLEPVLRHFFKEDLPQILTNPLQKVHWHLQYRCEWCEFFEHCEKEMKETDDLSRLPGLTTEGKKHLVREAGVQNLDDMEDFLSSEEADEVLGQSATLAGKRPLLKRQVTSLKRDQPLPYETGAANLPKGENIALFLTFHEEPLSQSVYLAGYLASCSAKTAQALGWKEKSRIKSMVARSSRKETLREMGRELINNLYEILQSVDGYNEGKKWEEQFSLQMYTYSNQEFSHFTSLLLEALEDDAVSKKAMEILLYIHGPDLMQADDHPGQTLPYPLTVLLSALGHLMALPVDTSYGLPESLKALDSDFNYWRKDFFHFPLGHGFRAEAIYRAWNHGESKYFEELEKLSVQHLYAVRSLLYQLRSNVKYFLFAWPPKFLLPTSSQIENPLLSRLAFFAQYESLVQCLALRDLRTTHRDVLALQGELIELEAIDESRFWISSDFGGELEESTFPKWLMVPDNPTGIKAALTYQDLYYKDKHWGGKAHPHRAIVSLPQVKSDPLGFPEEVRVEYTRNFKDSRPRSGQHFLLFERFTDYNSERIISYLKKLDRQESLPFLKLLKDPLDYDEKLAFDKEIESAAASEESGLGLTESQTKAYRRIRNRKITLIWGPPGTGKTHFVSSVLLALARAHHQQNRPFRVLVTAFTHAAIENVLKKIVQLKEEMAFSPLKIAKAKGWKGSKAGVSVIDDREMGVYFLKNQWAVAGATVWSVYKDKRNLKDLDMVIVDEASQVRVPEASLPISLLPEKGRLVLAGDDRQLPPIVQGVYPEVEEGQPVLHRSIFEAIRSASGGEKLVSQLGENFRMNDVLTSFSARLLYGDNYRCAKEEVARRRLPLRINPRWSDFVRHCLHPDYPLVLALVKETTAGKENEREAQMVVDLVKALRQGLLTEKGGSYIRDKDFFEDGLFLVSPHHAQIHLIRRLLNQEREWNFPPFIDTVEKMQGQESEAVIVSYGVSDPEYALQEAEFIYSLNRLNVSITRARSKAIVCLPAPLVRALPQVLEYPDAEEGLAFMQRLVHLGRQSGEVRNFDIEGTEVEVIRSGQVV